MKFLKDILTGFQQLPTWVQVWVVAILGPVNLVSVLFVGEPGGWIVAMLAFAGIVPNAVVLAVTRKFGREMALSHLVFWPPLIVVLIGLLIANPVTSFALYLWLLLLVDVISIAFDFRDARIWWQTRRANERTRP
ncbi:MAG: hypothetical protein ACR2OY_06975 [Boseongicola sp.]